MRPSIPRLSLLVAGLLASGCSLDPTFSEPALIIFHGDTATITAPASAAVGSVFNVSVRTFGGGCTRRISRTIGNVTGTLIEISPFNETRRASACTDDLLFITHTVTVNVDQPGTATI